MPIKHPPVPPKRDRLAPHTTPPMPPPRPRVDYGPPPLPTARPIGLDQTLPGYPAPPSSGSIIPPNPAIEVRAEEFELPVAPAPSFDSSPTEAPTGVTNQVVSDWRQILAAFDELDPPFKNALTEHAHVLLKLQNALKR